MEGIGGMDNQPRPLDICCRLFNFLSNSFAARGVKRFVRAIPTNHGVAKKPNDNAHERGGPLGASNTKPMSEEPNSCILAKGFSSSSPVIALDQDMEKVPDPMEDQRSKSNPAEASNGFDQGEKSNNNNNMDSSFIISADIQDKHVLEIVVPQEPKPQDYDDTKKGVTKVLSASKKSVSFKENGAKVMPAAPKKKRKKSKKSKQAVEPEIEEPTVITPILKRTNTDVDENSHVFIQTKKKDWVY